MVRHIFLQTFFLSFAFFTFAQDTTGGYPYKVKSTIQGFENEQITPEPFSGSSEFDQITAKIITENRSDNNSPMLWVLDSNANSKPNPMIFPNDIVGFYNREGRVIGSDHIYPGEGPWNVVKRVLETDSLRVKEENATAEVWTSPSHLGREQSLWQMKQLPEEKSGLLKFFDLLFILVLLGFAIYLFYRLVKFLGDLPGILAERARRKSAKRKEEILKNLGEGMAVEKAGEEQTLPITPLSARQRLADIANVKWEDMLWYTPVHVTFNEEVLIHYRRNTVEFHPQNEQNRIYFLGKTKGGRFVLCAAKCGNAIMGIEGEPLVPGTQFTYRVIETLEVYSYRCALEHSGCIGEVLDVAVK